MLSTTYPIKEVAETDSPEKSSETTSKASSALATDGSKHMASNLSTDTAEFFHTNSIISKSMSSTGPKEVAEIARTVSPCFNIIH
jgi:hypothetical protein